jgi:hypothetical protein
MAPVPAGTQASMQGQICRGRCARVIGSPGSSRGSGASPPAEAGVKKGEFGVILHGFWRSSAAFLVRIALNPKQLSTEHAFHHLRKNGHATWTICDSIRDHLLVQPMRGSSSGPSPFRHFGLLLGRLAGCGQLRRGPSVRPASPTSP